MIDALQTVNFPVWKTIRLGTCADVMILVESLGKSGYKLGYGVGDILNKVKLSQVKQELDLVLVSHYDFYLQLSNWSQHSDFCAKGKEAGLALCPAEVGLLLGAQLETQPYERLLIAMEPLINSRGESIIFDLYNCYDGKRYLQAHDGDPDPYWPSNDYSFVFVKSRHK